MKKNLLMILPAILLILPLIANGDERAKQNARYLAGALGGSSWFSRVTGQTDMEKINGALAGDAAYRKQLKAEYAALTNGVNLRSHLDRLGGNTGADVIQAKLLLDQGRLTAVDGIFLSTRGVGTDEKRLFAALTAIDEKQRLQFQDEWRRKYGAQGYYHQGGASSPVAAIEGDLSGKNRELALKLYRANSLSANELNRTSKIVGEDKETILNRQAERAAEKIGPVTNQSREDLVEQFKRQAQTLPSGQPLPAAECGPSGSGYRLCVALPGQPREVADLGDYIRLLYQFALGIAGAVVFIRIVWGGVKYVWSAGNPSENKEAVDIITKAIWGLVLLLAAVLILYVIDPRLLDIGRGLKTTPINFKLIQPQPPRSAGQKGGQPQSLPIPL